MIAADNMKIFWYKVLLVLLFEARLIRNPASYTIVWRLKALLMLSEVGIFQIVHFEWTWTTNAESTTLYIFKKYKFAEKTGKQLT